MSNGDACVPKNAIACMYTAAPIITDSQKTGRRVRLVIEHATEKIQKPKRRH